ncbi:prolactin-releasing peptide receptor-like [Dreissena polymorpha]|uniref:G-protein coupled receptors family 1 profile domain-containing protein n=1 Tax=Dreissena polymorpha TaxID=45954 RepID=A0A9D4M321_DREPO|nr:prolactin-releasing peptide receptor-like [Dreissena polymorpha]KAH3869932.1 hypothetical protein DPMN_033110 [Dreissena polymorpha]
MPCSEYACSYFNVTEMIKFQDPNLTSFVGTSSHTEPVNESNSTQYDNLTNAQLLSNESTAGLIFLYTFTTILSVVGNFFVILVFARGRRSRTDLRPFLINLAVSDLLMAVMCMPFTFVFTVLNDWIFSKPMCTIVLFVQMLSVSGSVFTNMAIGVDRFSAVMFPLRSRLTKKRAKYVLVGIWAAATVLSSVQFHVGRAHDKPDGSQTCQERWSNEDQRKTFTIFIFVITYMIPLLTLSVTYSIVGILLWKRTSPGNKDRTRDLHQLRSKRKVLKMLVIVVAMFGLCWLPLHVFTLIYDFVPVELSYNTLTAIFIGCHWLAMSNSFANPIIYGFTNESFRADLVTLFYMWFPCCVCLTKMMPRYSSGSTNESVVFRRQSLYKKGININGTYQIRSVQVQRADQRNQYGAYRNRREYENMVNNPNGKLTNGSLNGHRVLLAIDNDYTRLKPLNVRLSVSANSDPSIANS